MIKALTVFILCVTAACTANGVVQTLSSTPASITLRAVDTTWDDTTAGQKMTEVAVNHCRKYGRQAQLFIDSKEAGRARRLTFHCVP